MLKKSLGRYFAVCRNDEYAKFKIAQRIPASFHQSETLKKLWEQHARLTNEFFTGEDNEEKTAVIGDLAAPKQSYLDLKIEIARRIIQRCHLCSRRCHVNRAEGGLGYCRCGGGDIEVSSIFPHLGEEPELVPSGTVFTMGCTIRCKHCQNWTISQRTEAAQTYTPKDLASEVDRLSLEGCRNLNLVGGEPTPWLWRWLQTFTHVQSNVPVVWNSNGYYSQETAELLAGFADVYLLDFKYGPSDCAQRISDAPYYWESCTRNHLKAKRYGELIVRVLVLPGHLSCCTEPVLNWIAKNLGTETRVNLMFQYRPEWRAYEIPELQRRLTAIERQQAVQAAKKSHLKNYIA